MQWSIRILPSSSLKIAWLINSSLLEEVFCFQTIPTESLLRNKHTNSLLVQKIFGSIDNCLLSSSGVTMDFILFVKYFVCFLWSPSLEPSKQLSIIGSTILRISSSLRLGSFNSALKTIQPWLIRFEQWFDLTFFNLLMLLTITKGRCLELELMSKVNTPSCQCPF